MMDGPVVGIDEVGRGPWAGPVVAAAVILDPRRVPEGLADSKLLPREVRETLAAALHAGALVGIGIAEVAEVDRLNVLQASLLAMARAVARLPVRPARALVDGNRAPRLVCPVDCVVGGDALVPAISAASIVAKVARDAMMRELAEAHPGYAWHSNVGYGTRAHRAGLLRHGPCRHHRRSFRPVRQLSELFLTS